MHELVIRNGMIVDGSGAEPFASDLAIDGDRIAAIETTIADRGREEIDAAGRVVAPGFIDIHTHSDFTLIADRRAMSKVMQGVTSEVIGNCGGFAAPALGAAILLAEGHRERVGPGFPIRWQTFGEYLDVLGEAGMSCNVVPLVGHGNIRASVMGLDAREARRDEVSAMVDLLAECLRDGAVGMSSGLFYAPGCYSETSEVVALAHVLADHSALYATHIRDEGNNTVGLEAAIEESLEVARESRVRLQISHLEAIGVPNWGKAPAVLTAIETARDQGVDVTFDVNPYLTTGTHIDGALTPRWALDGGRERLLERFRDPVTRQRLRAGYAETLYGTRGGPERILITAFTGDRSYEGRTLAEIATGSGSDPVDVLMAIAEREDATLVSYSVAEDDARAILQHPLAMISSDGYAVPKDGLLGQGRQHPCDFGTYPRVIEHYCLEQSYWPIETAIAMCSGRPAARLGWTKRGLLREGFFADLVVFQPERVHDASTLLDPHQFAIGIDEVVVNGSRVVRGGKHTGETPGYLLRSRDERA